jgi:hypothetical protein
MSLLQKSICTTPIVLKIPTGTEEIQRPPSEHDPRFVLIYSTQISDTDMETLKLHCNGSIVIQYSKDIFSDNPLDTFKFDYLVFNMNKEEDLTYIRENISTWNEYVIIVSRDIPESNPWIKTLIDGNYVTNFLKKLPTGNLNKTIFDQRLLHTVAISHHRNFWKRLKHSLTPECLSNFAASVVEGVMIFRP